MSTKVRVPVAWPLLLAGLVLVPALAAAQGSPDTLLVSLDVALPTGGVLTAGPLEVPDPILPNPAYEAIAATRGLPAPLGGLFEDAADGLYVVAPSGAPVQVAGWTAGLDQRHIAPVELLANALDLRHELPVSVSGQTATPVSFGFQGRLGAPMAAPRAPADGGGASVDPGFLGDEVVPQQGPTLGEAIAPQAYQSLMAAPVVVADQAPAALVPAADAAPAEVVVAAIAAGAAALLLLKLLLPLYHRFKKKTALDNPTRARVYELLRDAPGSSAAELGERAALHVTTVKYHLDVLRRVGLVGEQTVDGRRRFFSYENGDRLEMLSRALLDEPAARAVYRQIETHPGLPFIEVARSLGMRKEHVHYHVQKLARHGFIADRWEGGRRLLFPATPAAAPLPGPGSEVREA